MCGREDIYSMSIYSLLTNVQCIISKPTSSAKEMIVIETRRWTNIVLFLFGFENNNAGRVSISMFPFLKEKKAYFIPSILLRAQFSFWAFLQVWLRQKLKIISGFGRNRVWFCFCSGKLSIYRNKKIIYRDTLQKKLNMSAQPWSRHNFRSWSY